MAWKSLEKLNEDYTRVRKLQLKTELNTVKRGNMSINDYASKIKTITNSLGSIGVTVDDDDDVAATLEGLGTEYKNFKYTPQQNEVVERKNRHIAEVARALMAENDMPHHFWVEAVNTGV
ncbi:hypothetical protein L7F22_011426 [Adiantum nelumboides]|nr:hypothetical protein [Adiantum nelumboides]